MNAIFICGLAIVVSVRGENDGNSISEIPANIVLQITSIMEEVAKSVELVTDIQTASKTGEWTTVVRDGIVKSVEKLIVAKKAVIHSLQGEPLFTNQAQAMKTTLANLEKALEILETASTPDNIRKAAEVDILDALGPHGTGQKQ